MRPYPMTEETRRRVAATLASVNAHYPVTTDRPLLTATNPKLDKGATSRGYLNAGLFVAPHTMAGANLCPWATLGDDGCVHTCLNTAGRGGVGLDASGWNALQAARIRRAAAMLLDPDGFAEQLVREMRAHARRAARLNLRPALRLNGTSDIAWHRIAPDPVADALAAGVTLYDYTKRPKPDAAEHGIDITYSYPGGAGVAARRYLDAGQRVAVVFATRKGDALPATWSAPWGDRVPVIDGDAHDLRFTDPGGVVVGLRAKGRARNVAPSPLGFVQVAA